MNFHEISCRMFLYIFQKLDLLPTSSVAQSEQSSTPRGLEVHISPILCFTSKSAEYISMKLGIESMQTKSYRTGVNLFRIDREYMQLN
jgi:hypothetical protein